MNKHLSACTTILVGKNASNDGSTMIARNDDTFLPLTPQRFYVKPAYHHQKGQIWESNQNGFRAPLPENGYRYSLTPNVEVDKEGVYAESGFNEKNVAMSATESVYGNERTLAYDPLVKNGLAEDSLQSMVLPYIDSARDGVKYLGKLIKKYGSPEGNGVIFSDKNEIWYMEIVTGHHWVAERIPDDAYAIASNRVSIEQVDFNDPNHFMYSNGIREFVLKNHLNSDQYGFNFRHIFGTSNKKDRHYNTPRVWFGQRYFNPEIKQDPMSTELPFICRTEHKIDVNDIEYILGSHFNETEYDPLGNGPRDKKLKFRPIAMNRTQNSHVLQIRNDVDEKHAAIMWLCFGVPAFSPYIPFFANADDTDPSYVHTPAKMDDQSAYWLYRKLSILVEAHYVKFEQEDVDFLKNAKEEMLRHINLADQTAVKLSGQKLTDFLTEQNHKIVQHMNKKTRDFCHHLMEESLNLSKLTYDMDKNL